MVPSYLSSPNDKLRNRISAIVECFENCVGREKENLVVGLAKLISLVSLVGF